jgi:hypothetical protein
LRVNIVAGIAVEFGRRSGSLLDAGRVVRLKRKLGEVRSCLKADEGPLLECFRSAFWLRLNSVCL